MTIRSVLLPTLALSAALLIGCASPPPPAAPAATPAGAAAPPAGGLTGGAAGSRPQQCVGENEPCGRDLRCCQDFVCQPNGRLGLLCRRPFPG